MNKKGDTLWVGRGERELPGRKSRRRIASAAYFAHHFDSDPRVSGALPAALCEPPPVPGGKMVRGKKQK